jgi:integrase
VATNKLNSIQVRNVGPGKHFDGGGLFLDVKASGRRYWRMKYHYGGVERLLALGVYPEVSLAEARQRHADARACLRQGKDPMAVRRAEQRDIAAQVANKFEPLCREWVQVKGARWTEDYRQSILDQFEKDAFPKLGGIPVAELLPADILEVIRVVEGRGALNFAGRLLRLIVRALNYAVATGRLVSNPARDLREALIPPEHGQHAALPFEDVGTFLAALDAHPGKLETRIALEMVVHTFVRSQEMRLARWVEFDAQAWDPSVSGRKYWRIPGPRMKMRRDHVVPLSPHVRRLLARLHPLTGQGEFLFPHRYGGDRGISKSGLRKAMAHTGFTEATVHGFRALASTELNGRGFHADAIERQLAHVEKSKSRRAYNRAEYLKERCELMDVWSDLLTQEKQTAEVLQRLKEIGATALIA